MKKEFLVERNGKTFVLYAGLLDLAHEQGLSAITTTLVQAPTAANDRIAIVHASVTTSKGTFTGIGDADEGNVAKMLVPHMIRMAETRAKARALRDAVNVGVTALEEMAELDEPAKVAVSRGFPPRPPDDDEERFPEPIAQDTRRMSNGEPTGNRPGAAPATPKQLETVQRMARALGKPVPTGNLSRAAASEFISAAIGELDRQTAARP